MSKSQAHDYPGLGLDLRHYKNDQDVFFPIGAHRLCDNSETEPFPVRELAMMSIMESLTDKKNWQQKIFDEGIVEKWKQEALAIPDTVFWELASSAKQHGFGQGGDTTNRSFNRGVSVPKGIISAQTFDCCVAELRSKAKYVEESGIVPTLEVTASVAKSDQLVTEELRGALVDAFDKLKADHATSPDWHPRSNDMVQDLVHPSLYPLVYGRSLVFQEECVGITDAVSQWAGKGTVIAKSVPRDSSAQPHYGSYPSELWSENYQWLPSNLVIQDDGSVKLTSYINNLHPQRYPDIYRTIEQLIQVSLPMWDQCLAIVTKEAGREGTGRTKSRFPEPEDPDDDNLENWLPKTHAACADEEVSESDLEDQGYDPEYYQEDEGEQKAHLNECKWKVLRKPDIPEPVFSDIDYRPVEGHRLTDRFRDSGLQIIIKLASIELTPEKPSFPAGGWHVEGQMNEHICATALYYLDSENITSSSLSFRMSVEDELQEKYCVGQDGYHWLESYLGTELGGFDAPSLQNYGSVETSQGRLLAFPNVFQHRVSPFELVDKTRPGHRRFIALWLVDPNKRIISTANVPPQQMSWYADSLIGATSSARAEGLSKLPPDLVTLLAEEGLSGVQATEDGKLPRELMEIVKAFFRETKKDLPMSLDEAREHRDKLMDERATSVKASEDSWHESTYCFCEH